MVFHAEISVEHIISQIRTLILAGYPSFLSLSFLLWRRPENTQYYVRMTYPSCGVGGVVDVPGVVSVTEVVEAHQIGVRKDGCLAPAKSTHTHTHPTPPPKKKRKHGPKKRMERNGRQDVSHFFKVNERC